MKKSTFSTPILFQQFFNANFDIQIFKEDNEQIIRDISIKNYVYSSNPIVLYKSVISMITMLKTDVPDFNILCIHENFPKNKLVEIMRPYLYLYYLSKYYIIGTEKIVNSYDELIEKFD